ncbi:MAG TPA: M48 family metallopeptidase, partial [Ignavibacteriaceae bacterium]|nr:M48 family metallopeptidase [Ignavibacteriaceae bacterium]
EGNLIENIILEAKVECFENEWKMILEGHSYKVSEELTPEIYRICNEVRASLKFDFPIDFYITNSSEFNAYAIPKMDDAQCHLINLNSALVERLTNDELRFVIGHEIGHLITDSIRIKKLVGFVYSDSNKMPLVMGNKIRLFDQLSELTADRYGFLACRDMKTCMEGFFKMSSGLDIQRLNIQLDALLKDNDKRIEYFKSGKGVNISTHPINPIRIKAIQLFGESELYRNALNGNVEIKTDETLEESITELIRILLIMTSSDISRHRQHFIASAGLIVAYVDEKIDKIEAEEILSILSNYTIFPEDFLDAVSKSEKVEEIFRQSIENILAANPGERVSMMEFLIMISIANRDIAQKEIGFLFHAGTELLGFSRKEVAQILAEQIRGRFMPEVF